MLKDHFVTLGGYNAWANQRLYAAVAELPEAAYTAPRACALSAAILSRAGPRRPPKRRRPPVPG